MQYYIFKVIIIDCKEKSITNSLLIPLNNSHGYVLWVVSFYNINDYFPRNVPIENEFN